MPQIRLELIEEGMELASDVVNLNGQVMIASGATITERELRLLRMWGVSDVDIVGDGADETPVVLDPETAAILEPIAEDLYRHTRREHPLVNQLFTETLLRLARQRVESGQHAV